MTTLHRLIVDTNSYAGNFERQSIAYATGLVGECGVGQGEAQSAQEVLDPSILAWWEQHGVQQADDHGVLRPAFISPTQGFFNHGFGGHFPDTQEGRKEALAHYKQEVEKHQKAIIDRLSNLQVNVAGWTPELIERDLKSAKDAIAKAQVLTEVPEYPAYQSVGVATNIEPPEHIVESFQSRMKEYLASKGVEMLGVNLETENIQVLRSRQRLG